MSNDLTDAASAALTAPAYSAEQFVKIEFPDGFTARLATTTHPVAVPFDGWYMPTSGFRTADGKRFGIGSIGQIASTSDLSVQSVQLTIGGLSPDVMAELRDYRHQGSPVTISEAQFDTNGQIIPDVYVLFIGIIDTMNLTAGETLVITITVETIVRRILRGPDGHRRTQADQDFVTASLGIVDIALQFAPQLKDNVPWDVPYSVSRRSGLSNI